MRVHETRSTAPGHRRRSSPVGVVLAAALLVTGLSLAASPPTLLNYQGVLRDATDNPLSGEYPMVFRFIDGVGSNEILIDRHGDAAGGGVIVTGGLFDVRLGSGTVSDGAGPGSYTDLGAVFRDFSDVRLRVEVDGEILSPDVRIVSAAYAQNTTHFDGHDSGQFLRTDVNDATFGTVWFAGDPVSSSVADGSVYINPAVAAPDETLLGIAVSGTQHLRVDAEGDVEASGKLTASYLRDADDNGYYVDPASNSNMQLVTMNSNVAYLNYNGPDESQTLYFYDSGSALGEYIRWDDGNDRFRLSDDLYIDGAVYGVEAHGSTAGGYFLDLNGSGAAYLGSGDRGGNFYGDFAGMEATDNNSFAWGRVGYDTYKILGNGAVSFVQNHPLDEGRVIVYVAPEGDEAATYTRGTARLESGEARVRLGETFEWVTNPDIGLTVYLTPVGSHADLYVAEKSTTEIVVRSQAGDPEAVFDYIVYGLRIGFEEQSIVQEKQIEARIPSMKEHRNRYAREPSLRGFTALERFKGIRAAISSGDAEAFDFSRAEALRAAVGEFDPALHEGPHPHRPAPAMQPAVTTPEADVVSAGAGPETVAARDEVHTGSVGAVLAARGAPPPTEQRTGTAVDPGARPTMPGAGPTGDADAATFPVLPVSGPVATGDLLAVSATGVLSASIREADPGVVGVVAGDARDVEGRAHVPVAAFGIVELNVDADLGAVRPGDLLVSSPTPGHAMRAWAEIPGTVIAKALEPLESGRRAIRVLVMPR